MANLPHFSENPISDIYLPAGLTGLRSDLMLLKKYPFTVCLLAAAIPFFWTTTSCKKTVTHTITDTFRHAWQPVTYFNNYGQQAMNSVSKGDSELVVAGSSMMVTFPVNRGEFNNFMGYFLQGTDFLHPVNGAPFINDHLCAYGTVTSLGLTSVPVRNQYSYFLYTPQYSDSSYNRFLPALFPTIRYPASDYAVIRSHYLLMPVETYANDLNTVRFDLLTFDSARVLGDLAVPDTPVAKHVLLHPAPGTLGFGSSIYFCAAFYDKFFVFFGGQFFRIDTTGDVKAIGYHPAELNFGTQISNMFTYGDTLFAKAGGVIFYSRDHGENWELFNIYGPNVSLLVFRNIGKDLYATATTMNMQIWKTAVKDHNIVFDELNNDGLEGTLVTSLTKCGKYVFATTFNGVYYRDTALFDQRKFLK